MSFNNFCLFSVVQSLSIFIHYAQKVKDVQLLGEIDGKWKRFMLQWYYSMKVGYLRRSKEWLFWNFTLKINIPTRVCACIHVSLKFKVPPHLSSARCDLQGDDLPSEWIWLKTGDRGHPSWNLCYPSKVVCVPEMLTAVLSRALALSRASHGKFSQAQGQERGWFIYSSGTAWQQDLTL